MATIHPSRLGLVPQSSRDPPSHRPPPSPRRPPPPRRRSPSPGQQRGRYDLHISSKNGDEARRRDDDYSRRRDDRNGGERRQSRSRSRSRNGRDYDRERDREPRARRPSPAYGDYRRPLSPPPAQEQPSQAPWHNERNMYPNRRDDGRSQDRGRPHGHGQSASNDYFEMRRQQRLNNKLSIWPPSPKAPSKSLSPERSSKRHRKHKRDRSPTPLSDTDSEEEERRRRRKRKEREREREKEKKRSLKDRDHERERLHKKARTRSPSRPNDDDEDQWIEKAPATAFIPEIVPSATSQPIVSSSNAIPADLAESDDDEVGPKPMSKATTTTNSKKDERQYGGALLRGEGSAMAAFLKEGGTDARIPRRGEIGLTSDEIAKYQAAGYVMSGSRHRVMNAVRMRKENQVISAEEKRGILKLQQEERERREMVLREEFQELLKDKLKGTEGPRRP